MSDDKRNERTCTMKLSLLSLVLLVGCGGDPFTTDLLRASSEAGDDVVSEAGDQDSSEDNDSDTSDAKADAKPHDDSGIVGHDSGDPQDSGTVIDSGVAIDSGSLPETSTDAPVEASCVPMSNTSASDSSETMLAGQPVSGVCSITVYYCSPTGLPQPQPQPLPGFVNAPSSPDQFCISNVCSGTMCQEEFCKNAMGNESSCPSP